MPYDQIFQYLSLYLTLNTFGYPCIIKSSVLVSQNDESGHSVDRFAFVRRPAQVNFWDQALFQGRLASRSQRVEWQSVF